MITINAPAGKTTFHPSGFFNQGQEYFNYADQFESPGKQFSPVPYFLYCQSIELLLKAWLAAHGVPYADLRSRKFGHNLETLLSHSEEKGLSDLVRVTPQRTENIVLANAFYLPWKFNYTDIDTVAGGEDKLPNLSILKRFASALISKMPSVLEG